MTVSSPTMPHSGVDTLPVRPLDRVDDRDACEACAADFQPKVDTSASSGC